MRVERDERDIVHDDLITVVLCIRDELDARDSIGTADP